MEYIINIVSLWIFQGPRNNILGFQDDKIEHLIYDMGLLIPNSKFLGRLRPKEEYLRCSRRQQFRSSPISLSILVGNNERYHYYRVIVKYSNFTRSSVEHYNEDTPITI